MFKGFFKNHFCLALMSRVKLLYVIAAMQQWDISEQDVMSVK